MITHYRHTSTFRVSPYKNHLNNVLLRFTENEDCLEIVEENNYYPFGLQHKGYNSFSTSSNLALNYKFGGKELNEELGLNWYDVSARNYDPALGRWMNLDPLAEQMRRHSPFNYAFDNPIYFIDFDGMMPFGYDPPGSGGRATRRKNSHARAKKFGGKVRNFINKNFRDYSGSNMSIDGVTGGHNMARPYDGSKIHSVGYDEITFYKGGGAVSKNKILQFLKKGMDRATAALDLIGILGGGSNSENTETTSKESSTKDSGTVDSNNKDGDVDQTNNEEDLVPKKKDTTLVLDDLSIHAYSTVGVVLKNSKKSITVNKNDKSIDSTKTEQSQENQKTKKEFEHFYD